MSGKYIFRYFVIQGTSRANFTNILNNFNLTSCNSIKLRSTMARKVKDDAQFQAEMSQVGNKLVIVDFTAAWCGICKKMDPVFDKFAEKYPQAIFLKVDIEECDGTAESKKIIKLPTFQFYKNNTLIETIQGDKEKDLENKIKEYCSESGAGSLDYMDLTSFINTNQCEALNESNKHRLADCLSAADGYLESDVDGQLIINLAFTKSVKINSLKFKAPQDKGPKTIKLFINQPHTLGFDAASANQPVQEIVLTPHDLEGNAISLRFVKFQNVQNMQIFVKDNQKKTETTRIDQLVILGLPISTTNMQDFKRVAGKKGEVH